MERGMFLAFEEEGSLRKLILKKLSKDEVDETMKMSLQVRSEWKSQPMMGHFNGLKIQFVFL